MIEFNVKQAVVKILQGSVVTQTTLGGLTTYSRVANFLQCIQPKIMTIGWQLTKLLQKLSGLLFLVLASDHLKSQRKSK